MITLLALKLSLQAANKFISVRVIRFHLFFLFCISLTLFCFLHLMLWNCKIPINRSRKIARSVHCSKCGNLIFWASWDLPGSFFHLTRQTSSHVRLRSQVLTNCFRPNLVTTQFAIYTFQFGNC